MKLNEEQIKLLDFIARNYPAVKDILQAIADDVCDIRSNYKLTENERKNVALAIEEEIIRKIKKIDEVGSGDTYE